MDVTSFLVAGWILWVRGAVAAVGGDFLCRRTSYFAVALALLAAYWAYNSISFMVEFRAEVLKQVGLSYMVQAYIALLMPFLFMALGLLLGRKRNAEPGAAPNCGPATPVGNSEVTEGPPSVS